MQHRRTAVPGLLPLLFLSALLLAACGTTQSVTPGGGAAETSVAVERGGESVSVEPAALPTVLAGGVEAVDLADLAAAAWPGEDLSGDLFDFRAADGFLLSTRCRPVDYATLGLGRLAVSSHNLIWDESLGLRGCYSVKEIAAVIVLSPAEWDPVTVESDGAETLVNLIDLTLYTVEGGTGTSLEDVVDLAALDDAPILSYRLETTGGETLPDPAACPPLFYADLAGGRLRLGDHLLSWETAPALSAECLPTGEIAIVHAVQENPGTGWTVSVSSGGASQNVVLSTLGGPTVSLDAVVRAGGVADPAGLLFDLVAEDGYRLSSKCDPVSGDLLDQGRVDVSTGNLSWDASLGLAGCYTVNGLVAVEALAP